MNSVKFYQALTHSFENIFEKQTGRQDITDLIDGLEKGQPLLSLLENENGSLSTLFSPFHSGTLFPYNFSEFKAQKNLDPRLIEFCDCASSLEGLLVDYELYESEGKDEPSEKERNHLLNLLRQFNTLLPSYEIFKSWLK